MEEYSLIDGNRSGYTTNLPNQTIKTSAKLRDKKWQENTIEYYIKASYSKTTKRKTLDEIRHNRNVMASIMDQYSLQQSLDPMGVTQGTENVDFPFTFYNIIEQPFNALFGEELKREFDVKAFVINQSAVNQKDEMFRDRLSKYLITKSQEESVTEEQVKEDVAKLEKWRRNDLQTAHEKMANEILQAALHDNQLNLKEKFNTGFQDLEVIAEEIYLIEQNGRDVDVINIDSENFWIFGLGASTHIEDAMAWVYTEWLSPNKVVAEFSEELTDKEIKELYSLSNQQSAMFVPTPVSSGVETSRNELPNISQYITANEFGDYDVIDRNPTTGNNYIDQDRNIRVIRLQWISLRKVGELSYFDEQGNLQYTFVDESYVPDESRGESVSWFYVEELWRGVKIGRDTYKRVGIHPIQMRSEQNPFKVRSTFIGAIKAYNGSNARSRLDAVIEYQNMFNIWMNKLVELWTTNLGKVAIIDTSRIPSNMKPEEWFTWLKRFKLVYENPFEESKQRPDLIAGNMQQNNRVLDLSLANEIQQAVTMLQWIEDKVDRMTAIPAPRQGNMSGNEGLGTSQQAILQSSNQTEPDFTLHEYVKTRVLETYIEYAKHLWKEYKGKKQYILSDLSNYIIDVDGALLNEADYGVRITNTGKALEMDTIFKQLIHPAVQAGTATLSDAAKALIAGSPSEKLLLLEEAEDKRMKQQQQAEQASQQAAMQLKEMDMQLEQMKHQQELEKINLKGEWDIRIKQMELTDKAYSEFGGYEGDDNGDGVEDKVEIDKANITKETKLAELRSKEKIEADKIKAAERMQAKELKSKKEIESRKAKTQPKK